MRTIVSFAGIDSSDARRVDVAAALPLPLPVQGDACIRVCGRGRQGERQARALSEAALYPHAATEVLDDLATDVQA
jgi:hypothetical protein